MKKPRRHFKDDRRAFHFHRFNRVSGKRCVLTDKLHHKANTVKTQPKTKNRSNASTISYRTTSLLI